MQAFFRMLDEEPVKVILFGDACPTVTDPIAKASKFFHLIQVWSIILTHFSPFQLCNLSWFKLSYADTFTATTANFFRIVPSEGSFNPGTSKQLDNFGSIQFFFFEFSARVKLLQYFNWTHVGTIYQNSPRYSLVSVGCFSSFCTVSIQCCPAKD